ncbi:hypothetical protein BB559_002612 [Furculomyces boomerangus]|uniref:Thioredoxin domain-containing protein n=2 Tax=Harpellales TaxID=61421 RepID=A0A2T9YTY2_9FUNG|nr:hypothetical protein BB559_002612 [Furculomyces boomerangus]PVZ98331.1 hypothetical protein BB558_005672 [Smittium angustum]
MSSENFIALKDDQVLIDSLKKNNYTALFFYADWAEQCNQVELAIEALAKSYPTTTFFKIDAGEFEEIVEGYEIEMVPTVIFVKGKSTVDRIEGLNIPELTKVAKKLLEKGSEYVNGDEAATGRVSSASLPPKNKMDLTNRLKKIINHEPVMVFIKGTPAQPRCGFSRRIVEILKNNKVKFGHFDILSDEDVRQGLKEFSNWPTFPQLYIDGELVGGIDIVQEMVDTDEFIDSIPENSRL